MSLPKGLFSRSKEILSLGAQMAGSEMKSLISGNNEESQLKHRLKQAEALVEKLGLLRGAALKAGQILSTELEGFVPPEVLKILSKLQDQAPSLSFMEMERILISDLGPNYREKLMNLEPKARAAASIGQVHYATYENTGVAVKIQYPGIAEAIDSDLSLLKKIITSFMTFTGHFINMEGFFEEAHSILKQEVNYELEAIHQNEYRRLISNDSRYVVPKAFQEVTTKRVLVSEWIDAISFEEWASSTPSLEDRNFIAKCILDLFFQEFYHWGLVQTDPNPGNFRILKNPLRLMVLDFGAIKRYEKPFIRQYAKLLLGIQKGSPDEILEQSYVMGFLSPKEKPEVKDLYLRMLKESIEPFFWKEGTFPFSDAAYNDRIRKTTLSFITSIKHSPPPRMILFLHRKLGGVFTLLKRLEIEMDLSPYWASLESIANPEDEKPE